MPDQYATELNNHGVITLPFDTTNGILNTFQLNFRNHRKIVITDGKFAFVGGYNVGDEYMGESKRFGLWRDLHIKIEGPEVLALQAVFLGDWFWASQKPIDLDWKFPKKKDSSVPMLTLATGPVEEQANCGLFFHNAINSASRRLWLASPYFAPDEGLLDALKLAALRGVDVRILLPTKPDHLLVWLASYWFIRELENFKVKIYKYNDGFFHEKSLLMDDALAVVGTANLDNRSCKLNFEVNVLCLDHGLCKQLEERFEESFLKCSEDSMKSFDELSLPMRVASRLARLFSPIL